MKRKGDPFTPAQRAAALDVRLALPNQRVVLVGAAALACSIEMRWRRTNDLDLTICAEQTEVAVKLQAIEWTRDPRLEQRWTSPEGVRVDILPVSATALSDGKLTFAQSGQIMNLTGFDLALRHHFPIELNETTSLDVATVPVIVVLKMVAWLDRPGRDRDLEDLANIFEEYLDDQDERRWGDDIIDAGISPENQSAFAIGQDVAALTVEPHRQVISKFLDAVMDDGSSNHAQFAKHFRQTLVARDEASTILLERLQTFWRGLGGVGF